MNNAIESYIKRNNDYWKEAENQRQRKKLQESNNCSVNFLIRLIRSLTGLFPKNYRKVVSDQIPMVKS